MQQLTIAELVKLYPLSRMTIRCRLRKFRRGTKATKYLYEMTPEVIKALEAPLMLRENNSGVSAKAKARLNEVIAEKSWNTVEGATWEVIGAKIGKTRSSALNIFKSAMAKVYDAVKDINETPSTKAVVFLEVLRETYKEPVNDEDVQQKLLEYAGILPLTEEPKNE